MAQNTIFAFTKMTLAISEIKLLSLFYSLQNTFPRDNMKKAYSQLYELNRDLILGYTIHSNNHMELLECLRIVNQAIQKTANLRG